ITASQLKAIMPQCRHLEYLNNINRAIEEALINSCARKSAFLAKIAHESGKTQKGDGKKFKGRGPIQLTGRANYKEAGKALQLDLINHPEKVKTREVGFRTSIWFWKKHKLNVLADKNTLKSFPMITKRINGGSRGQVDREKYWTKAKHALGR
ncbi:unnamed protein product, partial [Adineta steineri]